MALVSGIGLVCLLFLLASLELFEKLPTFEELESPENNFATEIISYIFAGIPYKCTAMIALGFIPFDNRFKMASSNNSGHKFHVSFSLSIKTG